MQNHLRQLEQQLNIDQSLIDQLCVIRERQLTCGELKLIFDPKTQDGELGLILRQLRIDCLTDQIDYNALEQFVQHQTDLYIQKYQQQFDQEKPQQSTQQFQQILNTTNQSIQQAQKAFKPIDNIESLEVLEQMQQQKDQEINQNLQAARDMQRRYTKELFDQAYDYTVNNILEYEVQKQNPEKIEEKPQVELETSQPVQSNQIQSPKIIKARKQKTVNNLQGFSVVQKQNHNQKPRQIIQLHKMHNYVQDKQFNTQSKSFQRANQYFQSFEL